MRGAAPGTFAPALDIEAEAWRRAFQHLASFRKQSPFRAWLLAIPRNLAVNHFRHVRRAPDPGLLARELGRPSDPPERREESGLREVAAWSQRLRRLAATSPRRTPSLTVRSSFSSPWTA